MATHTLRLPDLPGLEGWPRLPDFLPMSICVEDVDEWRPGDVVNVFVTLRGNVTGGTYLLMDVQQRDSVEGKICLDLLRDPVSP